MQKIAGGNKPGQNVVTLRIDSILKTRLEEKAVENKRSLNSEIAARLWVSL